MKKARAYDLVGNAKNTTKNNKNRRENRDRRKRKRRGGEEKSAFLLP